MHDIRAIRDNPIAFDNSLARRGSAPISSDVLSLDTSRRGCIQAAEAASAEQNSAGKLAGGAKANGDNVEFDRLRSLVTAKKTEVANLNEEAKEKNVALTDLLMSIPNLPYEDTPDGKDENDNVEIRRWGTPKTFNFSVREHFEITAVKSGLDFETAGKMSGSRFVIMSGAIARIHRALAQFMLDTHINENGLTETNTPVLVRESAMQGTGQLPKFGEDSYQTTNGWWLIPTSEVTLTNIVSGLTVEEHTLPRRYTAHSLCFRSEAGSAGRDTAGMLRQHQFEKVEMVSITHPDYARQELDRMTKCAEGILESLDLPYKTVTLCVGDMGFGARRTHDIEVWLPGQNAYREISSCSSCGDFQARRMNARFKPATGGKPEFLHTLNGSGLAVGRCLIAVLENGQQNDGSVVIPDVLHKYMGNSSLILPDGRLS
ncbi:MAG: serine--tRNA ligase [Planktomarina sp.]|nr:serine--tRNA ligase [Planktomarina sp.]